MRFDESLQLYDPGAAEDPIGSPNLGYDNSSKNNLVLSPGVPLVPLRYDALTTDGVTKILACYTLSLGATLIVSVCT